MANIRKPRKGSMGYWPRKRARRIYPSIGSWQLKKSDKSVLLGFAGYKVGMTHIFGTDTKKTSPTSGEEIFLPVTVIECPPMKIFAARFYKKDAYGLHAATDFLFKQSKELERKVSLAKKTPEISELDKFNPEEYADIAIIVSTQPVISGLGKKKPEIFEMRLSGSNKDKLDFIKAHADKEITVENVFKEAQSVDLHAITRGKGLRGPIQRFGIALKKFKSEKGRRQPGSRGGWRSQGHVMYRTAYSGQMGFHQRMQHNNQILKIGTKPEEINPKGDGFPHYGKVNSTYVLIKGSVPGAQKRMILMTQSVRPMREAPLPQITRVSLQPKQGR